MQFKPENFVFEDSFGYLISKLRGFMHMALDEQVADLDISAAQAVVLMRISLHPDTPAAQLCRFGGYDTGAMTRMLDKLEDKGLLHRSRSETDRRVVQLQLSEAGRRLCDQLPERFCRVGNMLMGDFQEGEVEQLKSMLRKALNLAEQNWSAHEASPRTQKGEA
jgi:DNA-binding MarR family transcriptional regulator